MCFLKKLVYIKLTLIRKFDFSVYFFFLFLLKTFLKFMTERNWPTTDFECQVPLLPYIPLIGLIS